MKLNRKCAMAMLTDSVACECDSAAIKAVMVVPIFAPRINGTTFRNETIFFAAIGTTRDVVTVLDRIAAVVISPQKNDFDGLVKTNLPNRSGDCLVTSLEMSLLKTMIDVNSSPKARTASTSPLEMFPTRKSIRGPNADIR